MEKKLEMLPLNKDIETKRVLKQLSRTSRSLAELKGIAQTMPNQNILINAIMINEAKTSSGIENIVTTHDEIYKAMVKTNDASYAAKEVADYRTAIWEGYNLVKEEQMINTNIIVRIQEKLEHNQAGIRSTLGTVIKNTATDEIIYTPPQEKSEILEYMKNLEEYLSKRVKVKVDNNKEFIGKIVGYVPAEDNEPEVEEIDILNEQDNKNYSLFENEILKIEILENSEK